MPKFAQSSDILPNRNPSKFQSTSDTCQLKRLLTFKRGRISVENSVVLPRKVKAANKGPVPL